MRFAVIIFSVFLWVGLLSVSVIPTVNAQFDPLASTCTVLDDEGNPVISDSEICKDSAGAQNADPVSGDDGIVQKVANLMAFGAGVIAIIIIIISGITMIMSVGDPSAVKKARDTILYSAVGLVVIVLARSIVLLIINSVG